MTFKTAKTFVAWTNTLSEQDSRAIILMFNFLTNNRNMPDKIASQALYNAYISGNKAQLLEWHKLAKQTYQYA